MVTCWQVVTVAGVGGVRTCLSLTVTGHHVYDDDDMDVDDVDVDRCVATKALQPSSCGLVRWGVDGWC